MHPHTEQPPSKPPLAGGVMRTFPGGATCSDSTDKPSYLKYISHPVWVRYGWYMLKHETQADGQRRAPGNWQLGIPPYESLESLMRHVTEAWGFLSGINADEEAYEEALCAILFRAVSMLHEALRPKAPDVVPLDELMIDAGGTSTLRRDAPAPRLSWSG